VQAIIR